MISTIFGEPVTPGFWYIKTTHHPGYTIVNVLRNQLDDSGVRPLMVWMFDHEGDVDFDDLTFYARVADYNVVESITKLGQKLLNKDEPIKTYDRLNVGGVDYIPWSKAVAQVTALQQVEKRLRKVISQTLTWAEQRCPCEGDEPGICPLCRADVEKDACMSAENTIPRHILEELRMANTLYHVAEMEA